MIPLNISDSIRNLITGLGTGIDKSTHTQFTFTPLSQDQIDKAYRSSWIARKVIDIPADDAVREWRDWTDPAIGDLEEALDVKRQVHEALIKSRLYGGACLYLGLPGDPAEPVESIGMGDLQFVRTFTRFHLSEGPYVLDIGSPMFGRPAYYTLSGSNHIQIHASRLVCFIPRMIPYGADVNSWGDSVLDAIHDEIKHTTETTYNVATMVHEAIVDIVKVPELLRSVSNATYRENLITRFMLTKQGKGLHRSMLLDKEDDHSRIATPFGGLPEVLRTFLLIVSGAADIPVTRMIGQSPSGLSATGESDLRNYYDSISADQQNILGPTMRPLDIALAHSALGSWPEGLEYTWKPLWQMSSTEMAQRNLIEAQAFQIDAMVGLYNDDVLRMARSAQLDASGQYPGFSEIEAKHGMDVDDPLPEDDPDVSGQFGA